MRRSSPELAVHGLQRSAPRFAAAAAAALALQLIGSAPAQAQETRCPDGLMRAGEAGTGMLLLRSTTPGCYLPAPRVAADFAIDVSGPVARTRVTQRFENPSESWVEGVYLFPLPESAAVDTLKLVIGDRLIEGQIKERQEARRIYEAAKAEGRKASLVEQERPNVFTNQVANIGPRDSITVQIEYQESLRFNQGRYSLRVPLVVAPRYSPSPNSLARLVAMGDGVVARPDPVPDRERLKAPVLRPEAGPVNPVRISMNVEAGFPLGEVESASHPIGVRRESASRAIVTLSAGETPSDRDFSLSFAPAASAVPSVSLLKETAGGNDYVLALVVPPSHNAARAPLPRETIFVLDNSGSMAGESIKQAKAGLLLGLDRLHPDDSFNVIRFDDTMEMLFRTPAAATPANIAFAKGFVAGLEAEGGTEMLPALIAALADATPEDRSRLRQVIFLTDGAVGNEAELFGAIDDELGRSRLFTIGIGSAPNGFFMSGAARAGRGTYTYIGDTDEVAPRMAELFAKLDAPVLTNLRVRWPDAIGVEAWPNPLPDLYAGEPVVLTLRASALRGTMILAGTLAATPWRAVLDLSQAREARGIERLWARNRIAALEESRVRGADPTAIDAAVLNVALSHHLVSRLTSLVAVDITPSRGEGAPIASARVPLNLPAGWDFDKVFGERGVHERQAMAVPQTMLAQLAVAAAPASATEPDASDLELAQGGTPAILWLLLGLTALLLGTLMLLRLRQEQA